MTPLTHRIPINDDQELVMEITFRVQPRRQGVPIVADCIAGEAVQVDLEQLNGYEIEVLSTGQPQVGTLTRDGAVVSFTPPADFEGDVVVSYNSRQKLGPPRVAA